MKKNNKERSPCCNGNDNVTTCCGSKNGSDGGDIKGCKGKTTILREAVEEKNPTEISNENEPVPIGNWKQSPNGICNQFEDYHHHNGDKVGSDTINYTARDGDDDNDPWTYSGKKLQALHFPLGGFGT